MRALLAATLCLAALASSHTMSAMAQESLQAAEFAKLSPDAGEAARIVDAFHAALEREDTAGALAFLAEDALIFEGGRIERSKAEYGSHHAAADAAYSAAAPTILSRRSGGAAGERAWIASERRATGVYKDKPVDQITTETMLLRRSGDSWVIAHIHWSSRPAT